MKKKLLLVLSLFAVFLAGGVWAASKVKAPEKETAEIRSQPTSDGERLERLRRGEVLTDGGYLKKGVWGEMEGVVEASPEVVWRLFIYANDWTKYGLPDLMDCRAVDEGILDQVKGTKKVQDLYKALGGRVIDPVAHRVNGSKWENYTFQMFNLPWPVSDKWYVIQNFADETREAEGIYKTTWEKRAGNLRGLNGELDLEPFDGNRKLTHLRYRVESDLGAIPRFLVKWGVKKSLPAAMKVIRRESMRLMQKGSS